MNKNKLALIILSLLLTSTHTIVSFAQETNCKSNKLQKNYRAKFKSKEGDKDRSKLRIKEFDSLCEGCFVGTKIMGNFVPDDFTIMTTCNEILFDYPVAKKITLRDDNSKLIKKLTEKVDFNCSGSIKKNRIMQANCTLNKTFKENIPTCGSLVLMGVEVLTDGECETLEFTFTIEDRGKLKAFPR